MHKKMLFKVKIKMLSSNQIIKRRKEEEEMIAELTYQSSPKIIVLDDDESPSTSDSQCFDEWRKESSHSEKEKRSEAEDEIV